MTLILVSAALVALPSPAAPDAGTPESRETTGEVRVVCVRWDADADMPKAYDPMEGQACSVAGTADVVTDPPENIPFARLHHAVRQLQADIDARSELTTDPAPLRWRITAARPNHLYYAALSLLRYANGVARESAHGTCLASDAVELEKNAATLDVVVDAVVCVNSRLRQRFGVAAPASVASSAPWQATDESAPLVAARLLERLMASGRRLDTALPVETTPGDIYDRLEDAVGNIAGLAAESLPPPSKQGASVADVYQLVFRCLRLSQVLEVKRNLETRRRSALALSQWHGVDVAPNSPSLQINTAKDAGSAVDLVHVYDLATLLAAQLRAIGDGGNTAAVYARPPEATLSDVFGLASALEAQLMKMTGITGRR